MWFLRSHPNIQNIFASIHNTTTEDLSSSLDGIIAWIEPTCDSGWFHLDQNPILKPFFESVQGLVNLLPVNENTGGNVLIEKSHLSFPDHYLEEPKIGCDAKANKSPNILFYKDRLKEIDGDDWLEIDPYDKEILDPGKIFSCMLGPGDVLIWDSRLVHCSYPASVQGSKMAEDDVLSMHERYGFIRTAGLVNMIPRSKVCDQTRSQRKEAINSCRTLTHWVDKVAPLGEERSEEAKKEKTCIEFMKEWQARSNRRKVLLSFEDLTEEQRQLV